ncbi:hypothetical protein B0I37DRAFT_445951 [Chaetomium sp. MPI-CAGE-AT-0009]|nr:hypothetical protein B0I37DRAFT_445951 [Chaetomium sp. MPI-CAGE-AT-0009]
MGISSRTLLLVKISLLRHYIASADSRTVTVTLDFTCNEACATITVFEASPSVLPSVSFIGCPEQLGLPPGARTVYRDISTETSASPGLTPTSPSSQSLSSSTKTASPSSSDHNDPPVDGTNGGSSRTPVIVGAVVGSVGGVGLLGLAFVLGRRYAGKRRTIDPASQIPQPTYDGKPELDGMGAGGGGHHTYAYDGAQQAAWAQQPPHQQPAVAPASELSSGYPAAHQLSAERGPYEVPGSPEYYEQAQTGHDPSKATMPVGYGH